VLLRQKRYQEAIDYYNRALKAVSAKLGENDAELGRLWGDLAIAHHSSVTWITLVSFTRRQNRYIRMPMLRLVKVSPMNGRRQ
jgi:Tetratricopeptide repeat